MYMGIDVGSTSTDVVIIDDNERIIANAVIKGCFSNNVAINHAVDMCLQRANISLGDIKGIISTGYGRKNVSIANRYVTEISCHAKGIHYYNSEIQTLIDVGGQDSKIIRIRTNGTVEEFVMNDKCSAGTGRFLEVMSGILDLSFEEMGNLAIKSTHTERISSVCTVFAESEIISKLAEGCPLEAIVAGIFKAISERIVGMYNSIGGKEIVAMSGGVAKNIGVVHSLSNVFKQGIYIPEDPQIIGALGAALIAKYDLCKY